MKHLKSVFFLMVVAMLILSACGGGGAATSAPEQPGATEAAVTEAPPATEAPTAEKKVATFIFTQEFDNLNPLYTNQWFTAITYQLWNCYAWTYDDQNAPVPVLVNELPSAENGGISEDGKTITFKLRDDLVWSDGTPITADDFIFTYEMYIDPNNTVSTQSPYDQMESVVAADPQTVVVTFTEVYAPWAATLWKGILPKHVLQPVFEADGNLNAAEYNRAPMVGCGPFNFAEWEAGSFARFVAPSWMKSSSASFLMMLHRLLPLNQAKAISAHLLPIPIFPRWKKLVCNSLLRSQVITKVFISIWVRRVTLL